jgi:hypothetical protein
VREDRELAFSRAVVALMKSLVNKNRDPEVWKTLTEQRSQIDDYVGKIGLEVILDDVDGYAYLKQRDYHSEDEEIPRIIPRHQLSYPVSLLLVLLRKKLLEFDTDAESARLILTKDQIVETMKTYMKDSVNEAKIIAEIDRHLTRLREMGFVRRLPVQDGSDERYEVERILCSVVNSEWIQDFDARIDQYINASEGMGSDDD